MEQKFTGVFIPAHIFNMKEISWLEKILWCEIQALSGDDGCYATNEYFAEQFGTTPEKISNKISKLKKLGLVEQVSFNGRVRKIRVLFDRQGSIAQNDKADLPKMARQGCQNGQVEIKEENKEENNIKESDVEVVDGKINNPKQYFTKNDVNKIVSGFAKNFKPVDAVVGVFEYEDGKKYEGIKINNPKLLEFIRFRFDKDVVKKASYWAIDRQSGYAYNVQSLLKLLCKFQASVENNINFNAVQAEYINFQEN